MIALKRRGKSMRGVWRRTGLGLKVSTEAVLRGQDAPGGEGGSAWQADMIPPLSCLWC